MPVVLFWGHSFCRQLFESLVQILAAFVCQKFVRTRTETATKIDIHTFAHAHTQLCRFDEYLQDGFVPAVREEMPGPANLWALRQEGGTCHGYCKKELRTMYPPNTHNEAYKPVINSDCCHDGIGLHARVCDVCLTCV